MRLRNTFPWIAALAMVPFVNADEIRLKDGSVLKGKITGLEGGEFLFETPAVAAPLKIKQADVETFSTDGEFFFDTVSQTRAKGRVVATENGVKVETNNGVVTATVDNIKDGWTPGSPSPDDRARAKLERRWEYTADVAVIGKTGNGESFGANAGLVALNKGPDDELKFYVKYNYAKARGVGSEWSKTNDELHAGLEYTSLFARPLFWYVRSDNGFDRVQEIDFFTTSAAGVGTMLIDNEKQTLSVRGGLAYRFESYKGNLRPNTSSPGLDLGLNHKCEFKYFEMVNALTYTPAFDDFSNFVAFHDSYIEMPLSDADTWKIRFGLSNQYRSVVIPGRRRMDTTYYVKFVLNWK